MRSVRLLAGEIPLWNPYLFLGTPFLANPQSGVLYPLNWLVVGFSTPLAFKISILFHCLIALQGLYLFARHRYQLAHESAALSAAVFGLGGYFLAKAEQINQFQGLAWLPWLLFLLHGLIETALAPAHPQNTRQRWQILWQFSAVLALQFLSGHTQTSFICWVALAGYGCVVWLVAFIQQYPTQRGTGWQTIKNIFSHLPQLFSRLTAPLVWGGVLFVGMVLAQVLTTRALSETSLRAGGLPVRTAISFSLHPFLLGTSILPNYTRPLFTEYVFTLGLSGACLCAIGLWVSWKNPRYLPIIALLLGGLVLAFGGYTPVYWVLAKFVPGFNLFRVPARWLAVAAIGASLMVGVGWQNLPARTNLRKIVVLVALALVLWALLASRLTPAGELGALGFPGWKNWLGWGMAGLAMFICIEKNLPVGWVILLALELAFGSLTLPLHQLTTPQAWESLRPALARILSAQPGSESQPSGRVLSLSALQFDPGDLPQLETQWQGLSSQAQFDAMVATKSKEMLAPNLPMVFGVPSVDGYDGGLLPSIAYANYIAKSLAIPATSDGRLREYLEQVPPLAWLRQTNTRWVITDKVGDVWQDGVYYDTQFATHLSEAAYQFPLPHFPASHLQLLFSTDVHTVAGKVLFWQGEELAQELAFASPTHANIAQFALPACGFCQADRLQIRFNEPTALRAVTLSDKRTNTFFPLLPKGVRLAMGGDVKVYEIENPSAVRFVLADPSIPATFQVLSYDTPASEVVQVQVRTADAGWLVLASAYAPGWTAWVDGAKVAVTAHDGFFLAAKIPTAGNHAVIFRYQPTEWAIGWRVSGVAWGVWLVGWVALHVKPPAKRKPV
ncbi:MAG TPA: YfhO family protein [Anaerolineales bacterium]|nr:YfhO family protein [Anaerolineales bacterium]